MSAVSLQQPVSSPTPRLDEPTLRLLIDGLVAVADHRPNRSRFAVLLRDAAATLHDATNALRAEAMN